ncbi:transcriptional repressor LexA [Ruminococcus bicirculans (ex Wegman et al. 2014)]|uniref:transcriptional repressor LexA n=2 Tax=Ruminococcus bicirculans (ex Wegman et al. 2014) TaxID=1160721 RepID=UPI00242E0917|nr:transcriptional repressor LexA [Ruminococcus bicirculans (ex Wegman et al. 2014)]MBS6918202.1 transcriptional repressor LexA [Ruminococcus bicirculans (ex Wegman et al. 2014)]
MRKVTENEKMVFEFIKDRIEEGYPPTVREICAEFGFKSTSTAHRYINNLTAKGLLEKGNNQNRAIRLTGGNGMKIPLVGTVTAGIPITAIEEITDYISFQPARHYSNPLFTLKVRGESMINAAILDGDMVVIEQTPYAENGDIVCALVDNESATIKTFYKEDGHYRLQPENDTMDPIIVDEVSILGKVVGVVRYL